MYTVITVIVITEFDSNYNLPRCDSVNTLPSSFQSCYFVTDLKTETTTKHDLMSSSNVPLRALTGVAVDEKV
jgi:hypothetical protein